MARREAYTGAAVILTWVTAVAFGISFWMGVACLVGRVWK